VSVAESSAVGLGSRPSSPYKGLAPFEDSELDELLFFGRERDRTVIVANLLAAPLTVLYGPTGVGKSSVLRAGVARDLRALPERPCVVVHDAWVDDPVRSLTSAVSAAVGIEPASLSATVETAAALRGDVFLLLDQLEAYFVYHGADTALAHGLLELVARPELPVHVLLAIREDALARLDAFKNQLPALLANRLRLDHLTRAAGRRAIVGPIEQFGALVPEEEGLAVEPELVEAVLDGVRTGEVVQAGRGRGVSKDAPPEGRVEAPYLQLVMQRLWELERAEGSRVLRLSTLDRLGGPGSIVEEHLERSLSALTLQQKVIAAEMFNHLVTSSGMKVSHSAYDLADYAQTTERELEPVLATLANERILRHVGGDDGEEAYEIFHDVLAEAVLAWRTRFAADRALERERATAKARHRRLVIIAAVSVTALGVMAAVAAYALSQRSDARSSARQAQARESAFNALALLPSDPERSLQLGLRAAQFEPTLPLAETTLRDALLSARGLRSLHGGGGTVRDAEFSPDGTLVATAGGREARLFRVGTGGLTAVLRTGAPVDAVSFSPDGKTVVTAGGDGRAEVWGVGTGARVRTLPGSGSLTSASFSPDGRRIVTTSTDRAVTVWDAGSGRRIFRLTQPAVVTGAAFSPNGRRLVTFGNDFVARVFDLATGRPRLALNAHSPVTDARFSPDGRLIATTSRDGTARIWDARRGRLLHTMSTRVGPLSSDNLLALAFSPDGEWLVTVGTEGDGRVWNVATGALETLLVGHLSTVNSVAFSGDESRIITAGSDGSARIWSFPDGSEQAVLLGHRDAVSRASFSPDGTLALTASNDGTARIWDGQVFPLLHERGAHTGAAGGLAFSPDGSTLASVGADGAVRFWPLKANGPERKIQVAAPLDDVAFGDRGKLVAAAGADGVTRIWSYPGDALLHEIRQRGVVEAVAFSPDGRSIATAGSDRTARITPLGGGRQIVLRHPAAVEDVAFSPDGTLVATASADKRARLWRARDGRLIRSFVGHSDDVTSVAFSPDGHLLLTASRDHDARIWDVATGRTLRVLHGHAAFVSDAEFSPDGRWVVTAGPGKAGVWAVSANDLPFDRLFFLAGNTGPIDAAAFAPSGWMLATAGSDGSVRTYTCTLCGTTPQLVGLAKQRLAGLASK
jgi:WD40 repeat protein